MSNYSNRNAKQPDVSPKRKQKFSVRDRIIAIMFAAALIAAIFLGIGAFSVHNTESVKNALAEVEQQKADQLANYQTKMAELNTREQALDARETELSTREHDLEAREAVLEVEKEEFYAKHSRVKELCDALSLELTPTE